MILANPLRAAALNLGPTPATLMVNSDGFTGTVLVSTSGEREGDRIDATFRLDANEGLLISLAPKAALSCVYAGSTVQHS